MIYQEHEAYVSIKEKRRLKTVVGKKKANLRITLKPTGPEKVLLLLTKNQIRKVESGKSRGKIVTLTMSPRQQKKNLKFEGGFLSVLAALAGKVLPSLLTGLSTGLISGAVEKAISGNGLFLQRGGSCYRVDPVKGNGLYLSPHHSITDGNGLFLRHGSNIYDGAGILLGPESPFKNIPILGWLL